MILAVPRGRHDQPIENGGQGFAEGRIDDGIVDVREQGQEFNRVVDRAHRIGQDKPVFVHRLIAEDTVEAAIQRMQARKQALADALFEGPGQGPLALTEEDIDALFGPG